MSYVHTKQRHPRVIWVNLRDDVTIQCDLVTYSVRDTAALEEPVLLPASTRCDIEVFITAGFHHYVTRRSVTQRSAAPQLPGLAYFFYATNRTVPHFHWLNVT